MRLSDVIASYEADFMAQYGDRLLPGQRKALSAMKTCRTTASPLMKTECGDCGQVSYIPHSCGHRHCPHCQHHESQQWLERQLQKQVPADYFLVTFTVPAELRPLFWQHQRVAYGLLFGCAWDTLRTFSLNDKQLKGTPGAIVVLHTHSRDLGYHPHVHAVMPAAALDAAHGLWREKGGQYLFSHKALAKVFRGKLLAAITREQLPLPESYPEKWVVDCQFVGKGDKALVYLGRYLYRGVIREKDILRCENGQVTYRYQDSQTKAWQTRTVSGAEFLWRLLLHVLPRGFRRARNYGFLHPNSKRLLGLLQRLLRFDPKKLLAPRKKRPPLCCPACGGERVIVQTRIMPGSGPVQSLPMALE